MAGASSSAAPEEEVTLTVKWSGKEYTVRVCGDDAVGELKRRICEVTNVLPKRQKLLYPKVGSKLANDSLLLSDLPLKSSLKMTMIGFVSLSLFIRFLQFFMLIKGFFLIKKFCVCVFCTEIDALLFKLDCFKWVFLGEGIYFLGIKV